MSDLAAYLYILLEKRYIHYNRAYKPANLRKLVSGKISPAFLEITRCLRANLARFGILPLWIKPYGVGCCQKSPEVAKKQEHSQHSRSPPNT